MPPYLIPLVIQYPSGTALSSIQVTLRNQSTEDSLTSNTNSEGQVVFDCSNFTNGYTAGDVVEWTVSYSAYEGSGSHTIVANAGGTSSTTLVLSAYPTIPALRYFKPKDVYQYFDLEPYSSANLEGIKSRRLALIGEGVEADIDGDCNTKFDSGNAITLEYHDVDDEFQEDFWLLKGPVQSITSVEVNTSSEGNAASWTTLSSANEEYEVDLETGRLRLTTTNMPAVGGRQVRVSYTYGRSSVPKDIKQLAIMETGRKLFGSTAVRQLVNGVEVDQVSETEFMVYRERIINKYRHGRIITT